eukprot:SAG31_NODE_15037_length_773_cov_5.534125_1_plen_39_part_10
MDKDGGWLAEPAADADAADEKQQLDGVEKEKEGEALQVQ